MNTYIHVCAKNTSQGHLPAQSRNRGTIRRGLPNRGSEAGSYLRLIDFCSNQL